jgi:hypothetical protein
MKKFRKRPLMVEAMRFTYPVTQGLRDFLGDNLVSHRKSRFPGSLGHIVFTTGQDLGRGGSRLSATEQDWIIKGVLGEFYPCKPDIFAMTYEAVE